MKTMKYCSCMAALPPSSCRCQWTCSTRRIRRPMPIPGYGAVRRSKAKLFGNVDVVCSSKDRNYAYLPSDFAVPNDAKYFHITTNNTIYGAQWQNIPHTSNIMVADMSNDILSRRLDFKNSDWYMPVYRRISGLQEQHSLWWTPGCSAKIKGIYPRSWITGIISQKSLLNTPPVFAVYTCMLTLRWLKAMGGLDAIETLNNPETIAAMLYREIDNNPLFRATVEVADRSRMNVCFVTSDPAHEKAVPRFLPKNRGSLGSKATGCRAASGASLYNALPVSSVEVLVEAMRTFARAHS